MPEIVKISELSAATALVGTEAMPLVQSGVTVRATAQAIADLADTSLDIDALQLAISRYDMAQWSPNTTPGLTSGAAQGIQLATLTDAYATVDEAPSSAVALLRGRNVQDTTPAAANRRGGLYTSVSTVKKLYRAVSGSATAGGFFFFARFAFLTAANTQRAFCGLYASTTPVGISGVMNDFVNAIGLGKDEGDTNLSIVHQGASGGATKTDLGVTIASLQGKTLELSLTADPGASTMTYSLYVVEDDTTYTGTISTALPAADAALYPVFWINSGTGSASVKVGLGRVASWTRY